MIKVNWLRLLLCMGATAVVSITLDTYFDVQTNSAFIAGLGLIVGYLCIRQKPEKTERL